MKTVSRQPSLFGDVPQAAPGPPRRHQPALPAAHTWFFALRPSAGDAVHIHAFAAELLAQHGVSGRCVGPERLHITLELVGHDVDSLVVDLACLAADTIHLPDFKVRFDAALSFAGPSGPFVLLGGEGLDGVRALRTSLAIAMADRGFSPHRAYEPHMTLCYDRRRRVPQTPIVPIGFHADEFALVKSHLGLSRHEVIRSWRLGG